MLATEAVCALALTYRTPFVSGKDSLHNEFRTPSGVIRIPGCILVTAMSVIADVRATLTSDCKRSGSLLVLVGVTKDELKLVFKPLNDWSDKIGTIDYDTLVYAIIPDWLIELDTFMQSFGIDVDLAAIMKAVFDPLIQPIKDAIQQAFIAQAQVFIDQLITEIDAKKDVYFAEYDARLLAAADPELGGHTLPPKVRGCISRIFSAR